MLAATSESNFDAPSELPDSCAPAAAPAVSAQDSRVMPVAVKLLLTRGQAGAIIGKSGAGIHAIQACDGVWLKLGGPTDFFPGTTARVLFLAGSNAGFPAALSMILHRLHSVRARLFLYFVLLLSPFDGGAACFQEVGVLP
jgi:hypothetical protein